MIADNHGLTLAMIWFAVLARFGLSAVVGFAGVAKFADFPATRQSVVEFGVPAVLGAAAAAALTGGEIAVAIGLLFDATATLATVTGGALLAAFSAAIAANLAKGRHPNCNCFGRTLSSPIGVQTLLRNLALAGLAALLLVDIRIGAAGSFDAAPFGQSIDHMLVVGVLALTAMIFVQLRNLSRQQNALTRRLDTLSSNAKIAVGTPAERADLPLEAAAPDFRLVDSNGIHVTLADFLATGRATLLVFANPHCPPCAKLAPDIDAWQRDHSGLFNIARISDGAPGPGPGEAGGAILWQLNREVADAYRCWGTPSAVLVRPDGTIGSTVAKGVAAVRALVKKIVAETPPPKPAERPRVLARQAE